jgi:TRAP-type mannitol/chloroaromatic compound transport system permease small subunit
VSAAVRGPTGGAESPPAGPGYPLDRFCRAVDCLSAWVGLFWGYAIVLVTFAVAFEIVSRNLFSHGTIWANETTIYLSAMAYLLAGGYALQHRRHVSIDFVYMLFKPRARRGLDLFAFVFFLAYAGTLTWIGSKMAWTSYLQNEGTGTPWDPIIWPAKMAIPLAGLLLLLQGIVNLLRDFGFATPRVVESVPPP